MQKSAETIWEQQQILYMQENGEAVCMHDFTYLPVSDVFAKSSVLYHCPQTGKPWLSGQLKNMDLAVLSYKYDWRSYCNFYSTCDSPNISIKDWGIWGCVIWMHKLRTRETFIRLWLYHAYSNKYWFNIFVGWFYLENRVPVLSQFKLGIIFGHACLDYSLSVHNTHPLYRIFSSLKNVKYLCFMKVWSR